MSLSEEAHNGDDLEFEWGKKRRTGGVKKEVQFYESFTYDGIEYFLYDCVYLYTDNDPEPYLGKLIKIWEQPNQKKKIKILWFFRPIEILSWLGDDVVLENEIFLASGEGVGLANIMPLEVLIGKCNVVCTSKDERNPQPLDEDIKRADYIFYRTFDVGNCTISDTIEEKVCGVEVKYIFNCEGRKSTTTSILEVSENDKNEKLVRRLERIVGTKVKREEPSVDEKTLQKSNVDPNESKTEKLPFTSRSSEVAKDRFDSSVQKSTASSEGEPDKGSRVQDGYPSKKLRFIGDKAKQLDELVPIVSHKTILDTNKTVTGTSEYKSKGHSFEDSIGQDKGHSKKLMTDKNKAKPSISRALKDNKTSDQILEVTRRPDADRSKWFKGLAWKDRIQDAHDQGTLVLLENLDPCYTSTEIEDVIWHGFKENCTAGVIQKTMFSSPHSGRAFIIFKAREAAETVVRKLGQDCLMLPNGRPLVASKGRPCFPEKSSKFAGHLYIDKIKLQMQREEMKKAVSTSHCSQPNTIEYEMALEWKLLQAKADIWWKELYELHGEELRNLRNSLKTN